MNPGGWRAYDFRRGIYTVDRRYTKLVYKPICNDDSKVKRYCSQTQASKTPPKTTRLNLFLQDLAVHYNVREFYTQEHPKTYLANKYFSAGLTYTGEQRHRIQNKTSSMPICLRICKSRSASEYLDKCDLNLLPNQEELIKRDFSEEIVGGGRYFDLDPGTVYFFYTLSHSLITVEHLDPPFEECMDTGPYDTDSGSSGSPTPLEEANSTSRLDRVNLNNQLVTYTPSSTATEGSVRDPSPVVEAVMDDDDGNDGRWSDEEREREIVARGIAHVRQVLMNSNSFGAESMQRRVSQSETNSSRTTGLSSAGHNGEGNDFRRQNSAVDARQQQNSRHTSAQSQPSQAEQFTSVQEYIAQVIALQKKSKSFLSDLVLSMQQTRQPIIEEEGKPSTSSLQLNSVKEEPVDNPSPKRKVSSLEDDCYDGSASGNTRDLSSCTRVAGSSRELRSGRNAGKSDSSIDEHCISLRLLKDENEDLRRRYKDLRRSYEEVRRENTELRTKIDLAVDALKVARR